MCNVWRASALVSGEPLGCTEVCKTTGILTNLTWDHMKQMISSMSLISCRCSVSTTLCLSMSSKQCELQAANASPKMLGKRSRRRKSSQVALLSLLLSQATQIRACETRGIGTSVPTSGALSLTPCTPTPGSTPRRLAESSFTSHPSTSQLSG